MYRANYYEYRSMVGSMKRLFTITVLMLLVAVGLFAGLSFGESSSSTVDPGDMYEEYTTEVMIFPGQDYYIQFDSADKVLRSGPVPPLPPPCRDAVDLVPEWLKQNLTHKFRRLNGDARQTYANLIINAPDEKYIDEIAFTVAHSSPQMLQDDNFFPELLTHNAQLIYEVDPYLNYVNIVEKSDYTTVSYKSKDNTTWIEVPRDVYYNYVVHPKLSDELPTYVDPDYDFTSEPPFNRDHGVAPPTGKYWREWLFYNNDDPVNLSGTWKQNPLLKDKLSEPWTLWDAVIACNSWVGGSMKFTSDLERPNQPVRIYRKHIGRCGEHQDMRNAIARAGLIPSLSTSNAAEDHVWNEFWDDERWIHWDGAMDNPLKYENGWGKKISAVWNNRGDGYIWGVTEKYSEGTCNFTATVLDDDGNPVDGALVRVQTENFYNPDTLTTTIWGNTDHTGTATFRIGDMRNFWASADSTGLGEDPSFGSTQVITDSIAGMNYSHTFNLPQSADQLDVNEDSVPGVEEQYRMEVDFTVDDQIIRGRSVYGSDRCDIYSPDGDIDFFIADAVNYFRYDNGAQFSAYNVLDKVGSGSESLILPSNSDFYAVLSNGFSQESVKTVTITVRVISEMNVDITSPGPGTEYYLEDRVNVQGTSFSPWGVDKVEVDIDNADNWSMATDRSSGFGETPWSSWVFTWDTAGLMPGEHFVRARATDSKHSKITEVNVTLNDATAPVVEFTEPTEETSIKYGESISISGTATDNVGVTGLAIINSLAISRMGCGPTSSRPTRWR